MDVNGQFEDALLMATWAEAALPATERDEHLMVTIFATNTGKAEVEIAAKTGYGGIEPWIDELKRYVQEWGSLKVLNKRIADSGLTVEGAIGFSSWINNDPDRIRIQIRCDRNCECGNVNRLLKQLAKLGFKQVRAAVTDS